MTNYKFLKKEDLEILTRSESIQMEVIYQIKRVADNLEEIKLNGLFIETKI